MVAYCQVGNSVWVCVGVKTVTQKYRIRKYLQAISTPANLEKFESEMQHSARMNPQLRCNHRPCWCEASVQGSKTQHWDLLLLIFLKTQRPTADLKFLRLRCELAAIQLVISVFLHTPCHSAMPVPHKQTPSIQHQYAVCQRGRWRSSTGEEKGKVGKTKLLWSSLQPGQAELQ